MIKANPERALRDLYHLRSIGTYKTGVHRPTLTEDDLVVVAFDCATVPSVRALTAYMNVLARDHAGVARAPEHGWGLDSGAAARLPWTGEGRHGETQTREK